MFLLETVDNMDEEHMKKKMKMLMLLGMLFMLLGVALHLSAIVLEFGTFAPLQEEYWSTSKSDRDAAATNSVLAKKLAEIQKFPPKLMTLKLVGVGSLLTGIFLMLFGILKALTMMPIKLAGIICPECGTKLMMKKGKK
jgi:hypothetical protein